MLCAAGAVEMAICAKAIETNVVPPTINYEDPDPLCDLDYVPDPGRRAVIEHAVCNCVGFGSKNSALVLRRVS
jgi:3-oxoacyl-[acyl-carrier-protein] synthase II